MINYFIFVTTIIFGYMMATSAKEQINISAEHTGPITFNTYIDPGYGFYKVRDVTTFKAAPFDINNRTLFISQGDTVSWINDADTKVSLSIVSEQGLWNGGAKLDKTYKFDNSGTYNFYLAEYQSKKLTVVVSPKEGFSPTPTAIPTPIVTPITVHTDIPIATPIVTPTDTIMSPTDTPTDTPIMIITPIPPIKTQSAKPVSTINPNPDINLPIKISPTSVASIIVAILSISITYSVGRNKK